MATVADYWGMVAIGTTVSLFLFLFGRAFTGALAIATSRLKRVVFREDNDE